MAVEWSRVDGRSPLIVHVLRDGKDLVKEKAPEYLNRTSMIRDGSLKLDSVRHQDSGRYRYDATILFFDFYLSTNPEQSGV